MFQDGQCAEFVKVLSWQSILAQTNEKALVGIQDPALFERLKSYNSNIRIVVINANGGSSGLTFLLNTLLFGLLDLLEQRLLALFLELGLEELILLFLYLDLLCGDVGHLAVMLTN